MNANRCLKQLILLFACVGAASMAGAAFPTAGGDYSYKGSQLFGDQRTTGQTGDLYITVTEPGTGTPFWPGANDATPYWQIFKGESLTVTGTDNSKSFRIMGGNVVFENAVRSDATQNYIGLVRPAQLVLRNGGSLTVTKASLDIGRYRSESPGANGIVYLEEPSSLVGSNVTIKVGAGAYGGAIWMDGGVLAMTNAVLEIGSTGDNVSSREAYFRQNGGTVSLRGETSAVTATLGSNVGYASLHIAGGLMVSRNSTYHSTLSFRTSCAKDSVTDVYIDGGELRLLNDRTSFGYWSATGNGRASLTVDGDGFANLALLGLSCRSGVNNGGVAVVNLNGGRLRMTKGLADYSVTAERWVNFNGGTLELASTTIGGTAEKVVYPRGGSIYVAAGTESTFNASPRSAKGWGVDSILLENPGSGYLTAPQVTISGGSGSNATAYAVVKKDRTIEKIVVTCRGEGYAQDDQLTVTISSAVGSGASATVAALTENTVPTLRKTGPGTLIHSGIADGFDGVLSIEEGDFRLDNGASLPNLAGLRISDRALLRPVRSGTEGVTNVTSIARLDAVGGIATLAYNGSAGGAELDIGAFTRSNGVAMVLYPEMGLKIGATEFLSTSENVPLVCGLFSKGTGSGATRDPNVYVRAADGTLSLADITTEIEPDNVYMVQNGTKAGSTVNAVVLPQLTYRDGYITNDGPIEIQSGMILQGFSGYGVSRVGVKGEGAYLTTRAKGGMVIWENSALGRSVSQANGSEVFYDQGSTRRFIIGKMADPDANTPMPVTIVGPRPNRPEKGALVWDISSNDFSGGLTLINGGVLLYAEEGLGRSGCPVDVYGPSIISRGSGNNGVLQIGVRPLRLHEGSVLMISPYYGNVNNYVNATLSGEGDLITCDIARGNYRIDYAGDHSAFTGDYYINGIARISPATFSSAAGIRLSDGTNGVGVIETKGTFTRPLGTGKGEICWKSHPLLNSWGLRGGFGAVGGKLTVNLGGEGAKLAVGSAALPADAVIQLQTEYSDGELVFANGFELGGLTQKVVIYSTKSVKTAQLTGAVSDAVGGGTLDVSGALTYSGTLEVTAANLQAGVPLLSVDGSLTLDGAKVSVAATKDELAALEGTEFPVATCDGTISGDYTFDCPSGWKVVQRNGGLSMLKSRGTVIVFR